MKKILLSGFLMCAAFATKAQTANVVVNDSLQFMQQELLLANRVISKTINGTLYALPQDGMPCLVPDSSAWTMMPTAKTGNFNPGAMPNPYKPHSPRTTLLESKKKMMTGSFMQIATPNPYKPQSFPKVITLPSEKAAPKKNNN